MPAGRHRFPRAFRLKRQRLLRPLFARHRADVRAVRVGPILIRYRIAAREEVGQDVPLQVGFAVGRGIGAKPDRNRVKRHLREAFRLHRHDLESRFAERPETLTLMVLYRGRAEGAGPAIRRALPEVLRRVAADLDARSDEQPSEPEA